MESAACTEHRFAEAVYELSPGTQVRAERSGLLFYQRTGPRLHFLSCGSLLNPEFFASGHTLKEWLDGKEVPAGAMAALERALERLNTKGVVRACKGSP